MCLGVCSAQLAPHFAVLAHVAALPHRFRGGCVTHFGKRDTVNKRQAEA